MNAATTSKSRKMTPGMDELLSYFATGAFIEPTDRVIKVADKYHHFANGTFVGLIDRKYVEMTIVIDEDGCERRIWKISKAGKCIREEYQDNVSWWAA